MAELERSHRPATKPIIPLAELRECIDGIDRRILDLLNQRAECAREVAHTKQAAGEIGNFYRPDREAQVLRRIKSINTGPLPPEAAVLLFREIMSACLALEQPMEVAYLGPPGTFSQQAVFKHFGHAVKGVPVATIAEIFQAVDSGNCQFGVAPVENSAEGAISHTLGRLIDSPLQICGEVELRVQQNLHGNLQSQADISEIFSHQQSMAQCRQWLNNHLPDVLCTAAGNDAEAAPADGEAAIASMADAEFADLRALRKNMEGESDNTTRFIIIGNCRPEATGADKTSMLISTGNQSGALHKVMAPLAEHGIRVKHIESRPFRQALWQSVSFIDIEGHRNDALVSKALDSLQNNVEFLKILGSYPMAAL
ncbi:MAG: prephenate dehydratase [Methylomonas sp.]